MKRKHEQVARSLFQKQPHLNGFKILSVKRIRALKWGVSKEGSCGVDCKVDFTDWLAEAKLPPFPDGIPYEIVRQENAYELCDYFERTMINTRDRPDYVLRESSKKAVAASKKRERR